MEKQGVIKRGLTKPESDAKEKQASSQTIEQLAQDPVKRMADTVADKTEATAQ